MTPATQPARMTNGFEDRGGEYRRPLDLPRPDVRDRPAG